MSTISVDGEHQSKRVTISVPLSIVPIVILFVKSLWDWMETCGAKRRSRIALSELTDDQLADIGITPAEARREASRPYWR
ncbi:DUF1127 domain-containing protein [Pararhizobium gei]|uniref:DUF1127 domain-containing protein n=1 Tax=Pararhizobium gei TaxID=1395951 RepID=UPI0023DA7B17|nr:DUF1127 domain-containing protein [Rhizobium gei]